MSLRLLSLYSFISRMYITHILVCMLLLFMYVTYSFIFLCFLSLRVFTHLFLCVLHLPFSMFPASISICLHCSHPLSHPLLRDSKGTYSREHWNLNTLLIFKKWANTGLFFVYFRSFQTNNTNFFNKYMWKNVHPIYGARIQTYDLWKSKVFSFIGKMHVKFYSSFYLPIPMFFTLSLSLSFNTFVTLTLSPQTDILSVP